MVVVALSVPMPPAEDPRQTSSIAQQGSKGKSRRQKQQKGRLRLGLEFAVESPIKDEVSVSSLQARGWQDAATRSVYAPSIPPALIAIPTQSAHGIPERLSVSMGVGGGGGGCNSVCQHVGYVFWSSGHLLTSCPDRSESRSPKSWRVPLPFENGNKGDRQVRNMSRPPEEA